MSRDLLLTQSSIGCLRNRSLWRFVVLAS
jgi:hypothetical protein